MTTPDKPLSIPVSSILHCMRPLPQFRWLLALVLLPCLPATATTVYKSVDESGAVSFSDTLPEDNTLVEQVEIVNQPGSSDEETRALLEEMRETTDRMATDRMAREKHRAEMRELQAKTESLREPEYPDYYEYPGSYTGTYTSGYYNYPSRRYYRPHRPVRPVHPIVRPPLRPHHNLQDGFPAPHIRPLFTPKTRGSR